MFALTAGLVWREMPRRPAWLDWDLEFSHHVIERMVDRDFTELDVRRRINAASGIRPNVWPRWEMLTRFAGVRSKPRPAGTGIPHHTGGRPRTASQSPAKVRLATRRDIPVKRFRRPSRPERIARAAGEQVFCRTSRFATATAPAPR